VYLGLSLGIEIGPPCSRKRRFSDVKLKMEDMEYFQRSLGQVLPLKKSTSSENNDIEGNQNHGTESSDLGSRDQKEFDRGGKVGPLVKELCKCDGHLCLGFLQLKKSDLRFALAWHLQVLQASTTVG
jgi:hypothetical protein